MNNDLRYRLIDLIRSLPEDGNTASVGWKTETGSGTISANEYNGQWTITAGFYLTPNSGPAQGLGTEFRDHTGLVDILKYSHGK